jgi:hypothetical protein
VWTLCKTSLVVHYIHYIHYTLRSGGGVLLFCKVSSMELLWIITYLLHNLHKTCHIFVSVNNADAYDDRLSRQRILQSIAANKRLSHRFWGYHCGDQEEHFLGRDTMKSLSPSSGSERKPSPDQMAASNSRREYSLNAFFFRFLAVYYKVYMMHLLALL